MGIEFINIFEIFISNNNKRYIQPNDRNINNPTVSDNRVLRRIFVPKRDGVTGQLRKLHNEELNDLYSSPNIVRVIKS